MTRILVLDTETGGLDPDRHSLLSLGMVVWDGGRLDAEDEIFVAESHVTCDPEAMLVNNIDLTWLGQNGLSPQDAVKRMETFLRVAFPASERERVVVCGHNVQFDVMFVRRMYRLAGRTQGPPFSHRLLDTASIIQFLVLCDKLPPNVSNSSEAFRFFNIDFEPKKRHSALADARATASLLSKLLTLIRSS